MNKNEYEVNIIMIENVELERVLEVIIDHRLCWKPHIKQVKTKVSMSIAILHKTKDVLNSTSLHVTGTMLDSNARLNTEWKVSMFIKE